jgi:predicted ester cyclase
MIFRSLQALLIVSFCGIASATEEPVTARFTFAPAVKAMLRSDSPEGELARSWVRYSQGLAGEAGVELDEVVSADVKCLDLEAAGFPPGLEGLRRFRQQINAALPDETAYVAEMRFPGPGLIEVDLQGTGTQLGEFLGRKPTGQRVWFVIHTLNRFQNGRMVQRWDRADFGPALALIDAALARGKH